MKKLLSLLGAFGLTATASATVVACGDKKEEDSLKPSKPIEEMTLEELKAELVRLEKNFNLNAVDYLVKSAKEFEIDLKGINIEELKEKASADEWVGDVFDIIEKNNDKEKFEKFGDNWENNFVESKENAEFNKLVDKIRKLIQQKEPEQPEQPEE